MSAEYRNAKPCAGRAARARGQAAARAPEHRALRGCWDIPGGFCEEREHPLLAAERELEEETGARGRAVRFLGMWIDEYDGEGVTLNAYYVCEAVGPPATSTDSDEVSEIGWFALDELPGEIAFPDHAGRVLAALRETLAAGDPLTPLRDRPPPGEGRAAT